MPWFLAWTTGRMELLFTEMGQAVGRAGFGEENQEFGLEMSISFPNGDVK